MNQQANISIEINRRGEDISSVTAIMPVWTNRIGCDENTYVKIPMLRMETFGIDEADLHIALEEALACFCMGAQKFGEGVEKELVSMGWTLTESNSKGHSVLEADIEQDSMLEFIIGTGETQAVEARMLQVA